MTIVIPVLNQIRYTRTCLEGLRQAGVPDSRIVVVDNGSTDDTAPYLAGRPELNLIRNDTNRGCAGAWNQGVRALPATWTVLLNNDVLIPEGWWEGLRSFAEEERMDVVSPAMCEGESDYDFAAYAKQFMQKMANVKRRSAISGVCFMVHRRVFDSGGLFDDDVRLGGYEDDEFFRRSRQAGFRLAMTGRSFIHHFGSVTQQAIKASQNLPTNARIGDRAYYRRKYGLTWFKRKRWKFQEKIQSALHRISERSRYHCTLRSRRKDGVLTWG